MATIYSGWSKAWRPSGSSYDKKYRSFLTYSVTTTATQVIVYASMGVNINSTVGASYSGTLSATGYSTASGSGKTVFEKGNTVTIIGTRTYTYNRGQTAATKYVTAGVKSSNGSWTGQNMTCTATIAVPALGAYSISYNSNGGEGAIEEQIKTYGVPITLSDGSGFLWQHHSLLHWNTEADDSGTSYDLGATYEDNADIDLYAIWKLEAIEVGARALDEWRDGIIYLKSHGTWVIPKKGYCKVLGEWKEIIKKEIEENEDEQQNV